jgi:hypothetical protein
MRVFWVARETSFRVFYQRVLNDVNAGNFGRSGSVASGLGSGLLLKSAEFLASFRVSCHPAPR